MQDSRDGLVTHNPAPYLSITGYDPSFSPVDEADTMALIGYEALAWDS
jgi:hypothetical protein